MQNFHPGRTKAMLVLGTLCLLGGCAVGSRESQEANRVQLSALTATELPAFPASWCGTWAGACRISKDNKLVMEFHMELAIQPIARSDGTMPPGMESIKQTPKPGDRYTWTITYAKDASDTKEDSATRQVRPYTLVVHNADKGEFIVDEGGGLLLPLQEMNGPLYCTFEVGGRTLIARYALDRLAQTPSINVEILTFDDTGFAAVGPAEVKVRSGLPQTLQMGVLQRKR